MPKILYAVNQCAAHSHHFKEHHVRAMKRIFRHIQSAKNDVLLYRRNPAGLILEAMCDADFVGDPSLNTKPMKSTSSRIVYYKGVGILEIYSKLQPTIANLTFEAEFGSIGQTCQSVQGFRNMETEIGINSQNGATVIFNDNQSAIQSYRNGIASIRTRHINIKYHYTREMVNSGEVSIKFIDSASNTADINTKALTPALFEVHAHTLHYTL